MLDDLSEMSPYRAPVWTASGQEIVFLATDRSTVRLFAVAAGGGEARRVHEISHSVSALTATPGARVKIPFPAGAGGA